MACGAVDELEGGAHHACELKIFGGGLHAGVKIENRAVTFFQKT